MSSKTVFDHVNSIYTDKDSSYLDGLSKTERAQYTKFMVNRIVSMNPSQLPVVNEVQMYSKIPDNNHYMFLSDMTPRRKQFNKYIKSKKNIYPDWLIELVKTYYSVSRRESVEYLMLFFSSPDRFARLRNLCKNHAIEDKEILKLETILEQDDDE
jgi:hypothetical protein